METKIIPVAGGKGGVGKSIISANLAIALAMLGKSVIIVDLDLGGSNLHTCLGLPNKFPGLGDFLKFKKISFENLPVETEWSNLKFIPGDGRIPFMANTTYSQKIEIIRNLNSLKAAYLILDLGSGTSYNTLDFYGLAQPGLVITTPDSTSIYNMLGFMKNLLFRTIDKEKLGNDVQQELTKLYDQPVNSELYTVEDFLRETEKSSPENSAKVREICLKHKPRLVINKISKIEDLNKLALASQALEKVLSLKADAFGFITYDENIKLSLENNKALMAFNPLCPAARNFNNLAKRIVNWWDEEIENSLEKLTKKAVESFQPKKTDKTMKFLTGLFKRIQT